MGLGESLYSKREELDGAEAIGTTGSIGNETEGHESSCCGGKFLHPLRDKENMRQTIAPNIQVNWHYSESGLKSRKC